METVSERIKRLINARGYTFYDMENLSGVARATVYRYANGTSKKMHIDNLARIANALGVSTEYLIGWDTEMQRHEETQTDVDAVCDIIRGLPEEAFEMVASYVRFIAAQNGRDTI